MITYFENHKPRRRPLNQPRRRPPGQPRRRSGRQDRKNGAVDLRRLDGVLQDLGFAPKPHPTIFIENEPEAVFDGLEKFQKSNGLNVDGAVKNKDSETGTALNKAMAEFYESGDRRQAARTQEAQRPKMPWDIDENDPRIIAIDRRIKALQDRIVAIYRAIIAAENQEEKDRLIEERERIEDQVDELLRELEVIRGEEGDA